MNVHGIYDTKASMVTFESRSEFQKYLQEEAGVSGSYFGFYAGVKVGWGESETQASQKYMALLHVDINRYIKRCSIVISLYFCGLRLFHHYYISIALVADPERGFGGFGFSCVWGNLLVFHFFLSASRDYVLFCILIGRCCCISFMTRGNPTCDRKLFGERLLSSGPRLRFFNRYSFTFDSQVWDFYRRSKAKGLKCVVSERIYGPTDLLLCGRSAHEVL